VELYTGARVIYFDEPSFNLGGMKVDMDLEDVDVVVEGGIRFNF
jgi:hypothetical protein